MIWRVSAETAWSRGLKGGRTVPDRFQPGKIAGKGEERGEGSQQSPVHGFQCVSIQNQSASNKPSNQEHRGTSRSTMATAKQNSPP